MTTPLQPSPDELDRIVGPQLETDLVAAGLEPPAARAIHRSLQFVVLNLLLVFATKAELRLIIQEATDNLRREFQAGFSSVDERFESVNQSVNQRFDAVDQRFDAIDQRFESVNQRFDLLERQMRWQFYILFSLILVILAAVLGSYFV